MKSLIAVCGTMLAGPLMILLILITVRLFCESRYLPTASMEPSLKVNDRVLIEKVSTFLNKPHARGEIIVFYPPPLEMGGKDLSWDGMSIMGRLTGLPFFPYEPAFIKRVIGLPGDQIRVVHGQGVFLNGNLLEESSYVKQPPEYDLNFLADVGGRKIHGSAIRPYCTGPDARKAVIVPQEQLFVLGDNRNRSEDSHVFGFVRNDRVIGRLQLKIYPTVQIIDPPNYSSVARVSQ